MTIPERRANNNSGYCECSCGKKTTVANYSHPDQGVKAGEARRFLDGHNLIWRRSKLPVKRQKKRQGKWKREKQSVQIRSFVGACLFKHPLYKAQIHALVAAQGYDLQPKGLSLMLSSNCEQMFRNTHDNKWITDELPSHWTEARLKKAVDDADKQVSRHKDLPWFRKLGTPLRKRMYCRHCLTLLSNTRKIWCAKRCKRKHAYRPQIPLFDQEQRLRQEQHRGDAEPYTVLAINAASLMSPTRFSECVGPAYVAIIYAASKGVTDEEALILWARKGVKRHWNRESDYAVLSLDTMKEVHAFEPAA